VLIADAVTNPEGAVAERDPPLAHATTLAATATVAIATWGGAIHAADGLGALASGSLAAVAAAGGAWTLAVPSLVVLGALTGSSLPWRRTAYATLVTVNFGGLCFAASVPVIALMEHTWSTAGWDPRMLINGMVLLGIGFSSIIVFLRTMAALEPLRLLHLVWISLFGALFLELAVLFDLATF